MSVSVRVSSCINIAEGFWNVNPSVGTSMVLRRLASLQTMALRWKVRTLLKTLGTGAEYIASSDNKNLASNRGNIKYLGVCVCVCLCVCVPVSTVCVRMSEHACISIYVLYIFVFCPLLHVSNGYTCLYFSIKSLPFQLQWHSMLWPRPRDCNICSPFFWWTEIETIRKGTTFGPGIHQRE